MADKTVAGLLDRLSTDYPDICFEPGDSFCWSPADKHITYRDDASGVEGMYSLLHEIGHASLGHKHYRQDFELLLLEVAAWQQATTLGPRYGVNIDEDHLQDCLDSYRDWLYRRSVCPVCTTKALQRDGEPIYECFNCHTTWQVAPSRFCRPYRRSKA